MGAFTGVSYEVRATLRVNKKEALDNCLLVWRRANCAVREKCNYCLLIVSEKTGHKEIF